MASLIEVEQTVDRFYGSNLSQHQDLNIKKQIVSTLHTNLKLQQPYHQDLTLFADLYKNYEVIQAEQAKQLQMSSGIGSSVYGSAVNLGGINNQQNQGGFPSAVNLAGNNNAPAGDTSDNRLSFIKTETKPETTSASAEVNASSAVTKTSRVMAKGYEIKPLLFKEFELEYLSVGMTQAFEVKLKKGVHMSDLSKLPTIEQVDGDVLIIDDEERLYQSLIMFAEDKKIDGAYTINTKEHNFIVAKNKPRSAILDMLSTGNFELDKIVAAVNAASEPLKTQLSKFVTDIYVPYILIAFRKNQIPIGLDNIVKDYSQLITYCEGRVEKGYPSIVLDVNAAIRLGDSVMKNIYTTTTETVAQLKETEAETGSIVLGSLKTLPLYENIKYLYVSSSFTAEITKNNSFFELLKDTAIPVPLKIDPTGSFQIYKEICDTQKDVCRIILFDGVYTYSVYAVNNEYYIFKN